MWLLDSKLHQTFPETNIDWDGYKTHGKGSISIVKAYLLKRHICKQGCIHQAQVEVYFHRLTLTSLLPLNLSCLSSNLVLSKWQTPRVLHTGLKCREVRKTCGAPDAEHRTVRCSPDLNPGRKTNTPHTGHVPPDAQACVQCLSSSALP